MHVVDGVRKIINTQAQRVSTVLVTYLHVVHSANMFVLGISSGARVLQELKGVDEGATFGIFGRLSFLTGGEACRTHTWNFGSNAYRRGGEEEQKRGHENQAHDFGSCLFVVVTMGRYQ
jgi:hypothetical protein